MQRSCYALAWLLGTISCAALVVGPARGNHPPVCPAEPHQEFTFVVADDELLENGIEELEFRVVGYGEPEDAAGADVGADQPAGPVVENRTPEVAVRETDAATAADVAPTPIDALPELGVAAPVLSDEPSESYAAVATGTVQEAPVYVLPDAEVLDVDPFKEPRTAPELYRGLARVLAACSFWCGAAANRLDDLANATLPGDSTLADSPDPCR